MKKKKTLPTHSVRLDGCLEGLFSSSYHTSILSPGHCVLNQV